MTPAKPFDIPKRLVWEAYKLVKANESAAGVDEQSLMEFEGALKDCRFQPSAFRPTAEHLNRALARWAMRKFKRLRGHRRRATHWVGQVACRQPELFPHWRRGFVPSAGTTGAG